MRIASVATKLREKITFFSGELSKNLSKPSRRFIEEMLYGIQASGSVRLSSIARSLGEKIRVKKTIDRLSNRLADTTLGETLQENLLCSRLPLRRT